LIRLCLELGLEPLRFEGGDTLKRVSELLTHLSKEAVFDGFELGERNNLVELLDLAISLDKVKNSAFLEL
jgi:hypothetical protein